MLFGALFFAVLGVLVYYTIFLSTFSVGGRTTLEVRFPNARGLAPGDKVFIAGTRIGRVSTVEYVEDDAGYPVRAYLELMRMRIPDRLSFEIDVEDAARASRCPPMTLLTLVENAVRHGIDPSEEGGSIAIQVRLAEGRCWIRVADSGVGLMASDRGLGTGLAALRERLALIFGEAVSLRVRAREPRGVVAELQFTARETPA